MGGRTPGLNWRIAGGAACLILGFALPAGAAGLWILKVLLMADGVLLIGLARAPAADAQHRALWRSRAREASGEARRLIGRGLALLLAVAAVLRLIALDTDLWMDEVFTLIRTVRPPVVQLFTVFVDDNQHTLYSLLAKGSVGVFGESAWALRLPAVAFAVAGIAATARLAELVFGAWEALVSAALLTFSYHHVWFSQNARAYTLLLCVASLSTDLLLRALRSRRWEYWILYSLVVLAGAFAHLTAVIFAVGQAIVVAGVLLREGRPARDWMQPAAAFALAGWLTLHAYALVIPQMIAFFSQPGAGSAPESLWTRPLWMVREILGPLGGAGWIGLAVALPAAGFGLWWFARRDWVFLALAAAPAALAVAVMLVLGRSLWPRSFFHLLGLGAIAVAALAIAIGDRLATRFPKARLAPAGLLCIAAIATLPAVYRYPKQDFTSARDFVQAHLEPGDTVAALHMAGRVYHLYYAPEWGETQTVEELEAIESGARRTWVIHTLPSFLTTQRPELAEALRDRYEPVRTFPGTLGDGDLFVLRSKPR